MRIQSDQEYRVVHSIEIKVTGMGGIITSHADRLKRDLESLGYKVSMDDPSKGNRYWELTDDTRARYDSLIHKNHLAKYPVIKIDVEQIPWGG